MEVRGHGPAGNGGDGSNIISYIHQMSDRVRRQAGGGLLLPSPLLLPITRSPGGDSPPGGPLSREPSWGGMDPGYHPLKVRMSEEEPGRRLGTLLFHSSPIRVVWVHAARFFGGGA